ERADARMLGPDVAARGAADPVRVPVGARERRHRRPGGARPSHPRRRAGRLGHLAPPRGDRRGRGRGVSAHPGPRVSRLPRGAARAAPGPAGRDPPRDRDLFIFPAGIRMVKRPRFPLEPLERLVARRPRVRLLYVGPTLDADEGDALLGALRGRPWARWIGTVPHAEMGGLLAL